MATDHSGHGESLSRSVSILQALLDETENIIQVSDYNTREILYANRRAAEFAGRDPCDLGGMRCYEYMMHCDHICEFCHLEDLTRKGFETVSSLGDKYFLVQAKRLELDGRDAFVEYVTDITAQKTAENDLRVEQEKMLFALQNTDVFIWEYDPAHHINTRQDKCISSFAAPRITENIPQGSIDAGLICPGYENDYIALYNRIDAGAPAAEARIQMYNARHEIRWVQLRLKTLFGDDKNPVLAMGLGIDITEQVEAEEKFASFWNYRQAVMKNTIASFRMNLTTNWCGDGMSDDPQILRMNSCKTVDKFFEYVYKRFPREDELERYKSIFSREHLLELFERGEVSPRLEYRYFVEDGKPRWIRAVADMQRHPVTGDVMALLYAFDIDKEKMNEAIIDKVISTDYDYIMLLDTRLNTFARFLGGNDVGFTPPKNGDNYEEMMRTLNHQVVAPEDAERAIHDMLPQTIIENLESTDLFSSVYKIIGRDGGTSYKNIRYAWLDRSVGHVIMTRSDVTSEIAEQQRAQDFLKSALAQAEQASTAKTDFLSKMSHEIRTPMNAIIGMNALAAQNLGDPKQAADCISKVGLSARYLLSLLNDILDMSRIESGKTNLNNSPIPFEEFLNGVNNLIYEQASENGLQYDSIIAGFVADTYIGDAMKLQQILVNLLGNAVKFTPRGGKVQLIVHQERIERESAIMKFTVNDTGVGISENFQKVMFDPFEQEHSGITTPYGGTGLGLAITKNLVGLMGGSIDVNSIEGIGTEFNVTIPLGVAPERETSITAAQLHLEKMSALVVDDDIMICQQTKSLLLELGMKAEWVDSGRKAVELVKMRQESKKYFDIILIDWKMPEMDGIETARQIRAIVGPDVTIIIITAYEWAEIEHEAKAAGVNLLVTKPLFKSSLVSSFERAYLDRAHVKQPVQKRSSFNFTGKRALLVEDHLLNVEVAKRLLEAKGMAVEVAENGVAAMESFAAADNGYFDVILMDIRMPVMDGLTAAKSIRMMKKETARTIPIIAMSANAFDDDVEKSIAAGMNAHLSKPIEPESLYETIARFIDKEN